MTPSSNFSDMYTSTVQSGSLLLMLHSRHTLVSKLLIPHLPILYLLPLSPHNRPLLLAVLLRLLPPLPPLTLLGFFNAMLEILEPGALNYFTFSRPILSTFSAFRESNLNSSSSFRIPRFSALRSDCTHSRSGILFPDATHASGGGVTFVRQGLSFSTLDYVRVNISLNNSSSVSFLYVYAPYLLFLDE